MAADSEENGDNALNSAGDGKKETGEEA